MRAFPADEGVLQGLESRQQKSAWYYEQGLLTAGIEFARCRRGSGPQPISSHEIYIHTVHTYLLRLYFIRC
jgi:hypothetical protein